MGKCLWEVAERLSLRTRLFRIESQMVGIAQHALQEQSRLIQLFRNDLTCARQCFNQPERAHVKRALFTGESVNAWGRWVTVHEAIADQPACARTLQDSSDRVQHSRIIGGHEEHQWHD